MNTIKLIKKQNSIRSVMPLNNFFEIDTPNTVSKIAGVINETK